MTGARGTGSVDSSTAPEGQTSHRGWQYLAVGCLTAVVGLVGGGMIAVLVAKIAGGIRRCSPDAETGAPCNWVTFWMWGASLGVVAVPAVAIWLLRRGQRRSKNIERG